MGKFLCVALGAASMVLGVVGLARWWPFVVGLLKGTVPPMFVLGGLIAVIAGITELRDSAVRKTESAPAPTPSAKPETATAAK